jgi:hypothetical protein
MLGTNFGLVVSQDSGHSWLFICELFITGSGADIVNYYKIGADGVIIAITFVNLWRSSDGGCTWTRGTGSVASVDVLDAFIDPNDPTFVLALAQSNGGTGGTGIYPSHDGGLTFGAALYTTPDLLTGIEIARSDGNVIYATQVHAANSGGQGGAYLLRSSDRGKTWNPQALNVSAATVPRIAAVDLANANVVYLRFLASNTTDQIAVTSDNGGTMSILGTLSTGNVFFTSFLRANDGTLYAGTSSSDLYVQSPGARGFTKRVGPRARCLGQRIGESRIYACGDGFLDGYNLGYSDDGANTFKPMMKFNDIAGPLTCPAVQSFCASQYQNLLQTLNGSDAGTPDAGTTTRPPARSSCATAGAGIGALLAFVLMLWHRRRAPSA